MQRINSKKIPRALDILRWAIKEEFSGFDPYDGLNIPILEGFPLLKKKYFMILITQFFKNFPVNLRPFLGIKKERNAKGIALFVSGLFNLYEIEKDDLSLIHEALDCILSVFWSAIDEDFGFDELISLKVHFQGVIEKIERYQGYERE